MLKIPRVTMETIGEINKKAAVEKVKGAAVLEIMEEFALEQPALVSLLGAFNPPLPPLYAAGLIWKAIKMECENSELQSFMDVK